MWTLYKQSSKEQKVTKNYCIARIIRVKNFKGNRENFKEDIANIILIGKENEILEKAEGLDISGVKIIDPENYAQMNDFIDTLVELRKIKV